MLGCPLTDFRIAVLIGDDAAILLVQGKEPSKDET
jgi:hypothetical protein